MNCAGKQISPLECDFCVVVQLGRVSFSKVCLVLTSDAASCLPSTPTVSHTQLSK